MVERREVDVDLARRGARAEDERRPAPATELALAMIRGAVGADLALRHLVLIDRHHQPSNDRRAARLLAHAAVAVAGAHRALSAIAHGATQAAAGMLRRHRSFSSIKATRGQRL